QDHEPSTAYGDRRLQRSAQRDRSIALQSLLPDHHGGGDADRKRARPLEPFPVVRPEGRRSGRAVADHHRALLLAEVNRHVTQAAWPLLPGSVRPETAAAATAASTALPPLLRIWMPARGAAGWV